MNMNKIKSILSYFGSNPHNEMFNTQLLARRRWRQNVLHIMKERKNMNITKAPISRTHSLVDYKLKYGTIKDIEKTAKKFNVPLFIKKCPYESSVLNGIEKFDKKLYSPASSSNLSVKIDPLIVSMPVLVHEMLHYFAFNQFIPDKTFLLLMSYGKKQIELYDCKTSINSYDNQKKIMGYTLMEHEYAAVGAENWANNNEIYNKITNNCYNKDDFFNDLFVFAKSQKEKSEVT